MSILYSSTLEELKNIFTNGLDNMLIGHDNT